MIDNEISIRLEWKTICNLACKALILGLTFNEVCELAVKERVGEADQGDESK